jgi:hypothetical protein
MRQEGFSGGTQTTSLGSQILTPRHGMATRFEADLSIILQFCVASLQFLRFASREVSFWPLRWCDESR